MTKPSIGWLPYGSDHPSVLYAHPLTYAPNNTTIPSTSVAVLGSGTQTHDSVRGMLAGTSGGYKVTGLTNHDNCNSGGWQMTLEVERDWLCYNGDGSVGHVPSATEDFGLIYGFGGPQILTKSTIMRINGSMCGTALDAEWKGHGAVNNALNWNPEIGSFGKGDFVRVNIGFWGNQNGGIWAMAIDGFIVKAAETSYTANPVDFFNVFDLGKSSGGIANHYVRNVQLASSAPVFPVIPKLSSVMFFGDSYNAVDTGSGTGAIFTKLRKISSAFNMAEANNAVFDCHPLYEAMRVLEKNNLFIGDDYCLPYHGSATDGLIDSAGIALALTKRPKGIVYSAGVNDAVAGRTAAQVSATLQSQFVTLFAGGVQWLVMPTIPSIQNNSSYAASTYADNVDAVNNGIKDAISTYTAANPTHKIVGGNDCDVFTAFGGHSFNTAYYFTNSVHPGALGCVIRGRLIGHAIIKALMD